MKTNTKTARQLRQDALDFFAGVLIDVRTRSDGGCVYYASEVGRWYRVTRGELTELGRMLDTETPDAYSLWCQDSGSELARTPADA